MLLLEVMYKGKKKMLFTVSDDGIFTVNCELFILEKRNAVMQFIIDTGAGITCCRAKELGINLKEQEFIANGLRIKYLNGVLKEENKEYSKDLYSIRFYEIKLKKFKIGTSIILPDVSVWVTFDNRFYTCLMGQNILNKLYYMHLQNTKILLILDDAADLKKHLDSISEKI